MPGAATRARLADSGQNAYLRQIMRRTIKVLLASPRGFCAGVDRAIQIVERAIEKYGAPVYVRHEIVHNRHVVDRLRAVGAVFVEELEECPDDRPVVFSAHGVPKSVPAEAVHRQMIYLDATCPLVSKVHVEAERHFAAGREIVLIGHSGHPEVVGTLGQLPPGAVTLIQTVEEAEAFVPRDAGNLAFVTQTTLSLDDTAEMVEALRRRFPQIAAPHKEDICYATTNRQGRGQGAGGPLRPAAGGRGAQFVQFGSAGRGGAEGWRAGRQADRRGGQHRLAVGSMASRRSASPPAPPPPNCWCRACWRR